ncbi:uncharacterized protein LOC132757824 [Ruditapes philippinarum]|uniref:uncharacterized protein LOC132757824 n=1 Tax=Ruditapes philippinarum TaxID=129788 RepID=UPI00295A94C3|nr:uncharacterized protein LOC132757824 [Ruditapes philippinarum]
MCLRWTSFLLVASCLTLSKAATTMMPFTTTHHQPYEFENFVFQFDGTTGTMTVRSSNKCYIWQITTQEHQQIHTDDGLRNVELRVLKEMNNAYYTVVPKSILHPTIQYACTKQASHFYLVH